MLEASTTRTTGNPSHFRGTAGLVVPVATVEQPHHAFHDAYGAVVQAARERGAVVRARQHPAVEVSGLPAADRSVVAGIDEIRPDLERLNGHPAILERSEQSEGQRGFADTAVCAGHDEAAYPPLTFHGYNGTRSRAYAVHDQPQAST